MTTSTSIMRTRTGVANIAPPTDESIRDAARWTLGVTGTEFSTPSHRAGSYFVGAMVTGALLFSVTGTAATVPNISEDHARLIAFGRGGTGIITAESGPVLVAPPTSDAIAANSAVVNTVREADQVRWLHQASGLTWDQLGRLFGVSRRSVHLWANGGRLNAANAAKLAQVVALVREMKARTPDDRRAQLLAAGPDGRSIVDRMRERQYDGDISGTPWSPAQLLGAQHDRSASTT